MSKVMLFYLNKQELNWIRYAFTFGRSFSSHSTLSIAFKVSWPPTNLPIWLMLKGLTSSFSFVLFFGKLSVQQWRIQGRGAEGPAFPLLIEQSEARRAEKNFFETAPPRPPTLSEGLDPLLNNLQYSSWKVPSCTNEHNKCIKMLPAKHGMLFIQMTTRAKRNEATSKQITLWILHWMD